MPNPNHTKTRGIRIPDDRWDAAVANATARDTNVSKLVNGWLEEYNAECDANPVEVTETQPAAS